MFPTPITAILAPDRLGVRTRNNESAARTVKSFPLYESMIDFFKDCLDRKKLQRVKDVTYNKETGEITTIGAVV